METIALTVRRNTVGQTHDGRDVEALTLMNSNGVAVSVLAFGATLHRFIVPDRLGVFGDIILGHDAVEPYWRTPNYLGVTVGRFANRIRNAAFVIDEANFDLEANDNHNHLHGGRDGFDQRVWTVESLVPEKSEFTLSLISPDKDGGYPGELTVRSRWSLDDTDALTITFEATTTRPTVVNLTNHAFFNLGGPDNPRPATDHLLTVYADHYTPVDAELIPTGEVKRVDDTPFDFRQGKRIARDLVADDDQLRLAQGYDHNMVIRGDRGVLRPAARLEDPVSGRCLEVFTTEPGLQFYSGNFLDGSLIGKGGRPMRRGDGICLEPQTFPDAPNQPGFPSARLDPDRTYRHTICFRSSVSQ